MDAQVEFPMNYRIVTKKYQYTRVAIDTELNSFISLTQAEGLVVDVLAVSFPPMNPHEVWYTLRIWKPGDFFNNVR